MVRQVFCQNQIIIQDFCSCKFGGIHYSDCSDCALLACDCVLLLVDTYILEEHAGSIFRSERCRVRDLFSYIFRLQGRWSLRPKWLPLLQVAYMFQLISHPTHLNPEDRGSVYLWNISIHIQDHGVTTQKTTVWTFMVSSQ